MINCEEFNFEFKDTNYDLCDTEMRSLTGVEGILINPRWAHYKFNPKTQDVEPTPGSGLTLEEFKKFKISEEVMSDGILFIWVEKEIIS